MNEILILVVFIFVIFIFVISWISWIWFVFFFNNQPPILGTTTKKIEKFKGVRKVCFYVYYEKDEEYKKNFEFFQRYGIYDNMDYVIILNGKCTVPIVVIQRDNVRILYRDNIGYDFGAYAHGLVVLGKKKENYDYFFFINTSVRGPYMYPDSEKDLSSWSDTFIDLFDGKDVHLVGCTINVNVNCWWVESYYKRPGPFPHVQSYVFVLDRAGLDLLEPTIFSTDNPTCSFDETILKYEIGMSEKILKNNWNIACTARKYQGYDYRTLKSNINTSALVYYGDPCYPFAYFGDHLDAREIIFIKTNRGLFVP